MKPYPILDEQQQIHLFDEPKYDLSVAILGIPSFRMLPGIQMDQRNMAWGMGFIEVYFNKMGIKLSDEGLFSMKTLSKIYFDMFEEFGFYVHLFGEKDLMAELTPEEHAAKAEFQEEMDNVAKSLQTNN